MTNIRTKTKALGDRHTQITVTNRLAFITKALKTKAENRLVSVYAGFDTLEAADRFAAWAQVNWDKTSYQVIVRQGKRTQSPYEVKVRRPTQAQLQALIAKAQLHAPTPAIDFDNAPLLPRRRATTATVGGKQFSID